MYMCIHGMVTTTNTTKPDLEKNYKKKDKAFFFTTSAHYLKKKTGPGFPRGLSIYLFIFHCLAFKFSHGVPRSDTRITAWHTYNNNRA